MPSVKKKILLGAGGAVGAGIVAWRTLFPWLSYDLKIMKAGLKAQKLILRDQVAHRYLICMFEEAVIKHPKKPFIIFEDRIYTYEYVNDQVNRVANIAARWGMQVGDCVAIMMQNEPAFIWTFLGLQKLGIAVAFLNFHVRGQPLVHTIHSCEAKLLIVGQGEDILHGVEDVRPMLNGMPIYVQGANLLLADCYQNWDEEMRLTPPLPVCPSLREGMTLLTHCCYIFTSGTTGLPKPVVIRQTKAISISKFYQLINFVPSDIAYATTPLYHSAAGGICLMGVLDQDVVRMGDLVAPVFKLTDLVNLCSTRLEQLGTHVTGRVHPTKLKNRILSYFPNMDAHKQCRDVVLVCNEDVGAALGNACQHDADNEAVHLARAANIVRRHMFKLKQGFSGSFDAHCQEESVPVSLLALVSMVLYCSNITT